MNKLLLTFIISYVVFFAVFPDVILNCINDLLSAISTPDMMGSRSSKRSIGMLQQFISELLVDEASNGTANSTESGPWQIDLTLKPLRSESQT